MTITGSPSEQQDYSGQFLAYADRFSTLVDAVTDWTAHTACEEWTAADLVGHVVDTERDYLTQRGATLADRPGDPGDAWRTHVGDVRQLLADRDFATLPFDGYFRPTTVEKLLATFYGFDLVIHRWDLGRAAGVDVSWTDDELDGIQAGVESLGEMLYSDGVCKPALPVPEGADRQTALLARLGRRA